MWDDGTVWRGAEQGRLLLRKCGHCDEICHPPLPMCPRCQSLDWVEVAATGNATLRSWLVSVHPGRPESEPRVTCVVELEEGVHFVSNLIGTRLDELGEGMKLQVCFEPIDGEVLPQFRAAGAPE